MTEISEVAKFADVGAKLIAQTTRLRANLGDSYSEVAKAEIPMPDALVMLKVHQKCKCCDSIAIHINRHLQVRFGEQRVAIRRWTSEFNGLPREKHEVTVESASCEKCFESGRRFDNSVVVGSRS